MIGSFITTPYTLMHHNLCRDFWWNIKLPRWLRPPKAQIWCPATSGFSQNKITFEREEVSDCWWHVGVVVLCSMFFVSSLINVSIFHMIWLDTFWTDLIYLDFAFYILLSKYFYNPPNLSIFILFNSHNLHLHMLSTS